MNRALFIVSACVALFSFVTAQQYTDKWDSIDLDEILSNERLLKKYVDCLLADADTGCTADGKELKKNLPDALNSECSKCTEKQRSGSEKVIKFLIDNKQDIWKQLEAKFDPEGTYKKKYEAEAQKRGIKV